MHFAQATFTLKNGEQAQAAMQAVIDAGGYVRPEPDKPNTISVVCDASELEAVRGTIQNIENPPAQPETAQGEQNQGEAKSGALK